MAIVDELRDAALRMERGAFLQEPELLLSAAAEITTLRAQVAELEKRVAAKSQEVVDVLNNAEQYYADFRARIAELEREKGALRQALIDAQTALCAGYMAPKDHDALMVEINALLED